MESSSDPENTAIKENQAGSRFNEAENESSLRRFGGRRKMQLSEHFSLEEFIRSDTAKRLEKRQQADAAASGTFEATAAGFEKVRALLGGQALKITSGYRNPAVNKAVGGTPTSAHPMVMPATSAIPC